MNTYRIYYFGPTQDPFLMPGIITADGVREERERTVFHKDTETVASFPTHLIGYTMEKAEQKEQP